MSDATSKEITCGKCDDYQMPWDSYPCNACTRDGSGRQTDHFSRGRPVPESKSVPKNNATELADAHWSYVEELLMAHQVQAQKVDEAKFHYKSAFIHGYKHAMEEQETTGQLGRPKHADTSKVRRMLHNGASEATVLETTGVSRSTYYRIKAEGQH